MGGRGSSSGVSESGYLYGTEFETVAQIGEVKFVRHKNGSVTAPMETMHKGRIYATLDFNNDVKHITYYDAAGERSKQIDVKGAMHNGLIPHAHVGYEHGEITTRDLTASERSKVQSILEAWAKRRKRLNL